MKKYKETWTILSRIIAHGRVPFMRLIQNSPFREISEYNGRTNNRRARTTSVRNDQLTGGTRKRDEMYFSFSFFFFSIQSTFSATKCMKLREKLFLNESKNEKKNSFLLYRINNDCFMILS